eukprot:TRINITY_DN479_c0_g1_i4.p1 TRINITY_DN479_c0_g1~~TRINITY_DN479_c0_g1_i4.p1  ORF type:complete len:455 (+),score=105.57 TRINITY_DN479_c0_g1_i4:499-1863(+)
MTSKTTFLGLTHANEGEDGEVEGDGSSSDEPTTANQQRNISSSVVAVTKSIPSKQGPSLISSTSQQIHKAAPVPSSPTPSYDEGEIIDASDDDEIMGAPTQSFAAQTEKSAESLKQAPIQPKKVMSKEADGEVMSDDDEEEGLVDLDDDDDGLWEGMTLEQLKTSRYFEDTNTGLFYDTWTGVYMNKNVETGEMCECMNPYVYNCPKLRLYCIVSNHLSTATLIEVERHGVTIGSGKKGGNHFCFEDTEVSELHCAIGFDITRNVFFVQDRGSRTGTFVNGRRLGMNGSPIECAVELGTFVQIGTSIFQVHVHDFWPSDCKLCRVPEDVKVEPISKDGKATDTADVFASVDPNAKLTRAMIRRIRRHEVNRLKRLYGIPIKKKGKKARWRRVQVRQAARRAFRLANKPDTSGIMPLSELESIEAAARAQMDLEEQKKNTKESKAGGGSRKGKSH